MAPPAYASVNLLESATSIACSLPDTALPAALLRDRRAGTVSRGTASGATWTATWPVAQSPAFVCVLNTTATSITLERESSPGVWTLVTTLTGVAGAAWEAALSGSSASWRITIAVASGVPSIGEWWLGAAPTVLSRGYGLGALFGTDYQVARVTSEYGLPSAYLLSQARVWEASWRPAIAAAQQAELAALHAAAQGGARSLLWIPDNDVKTDAAIARAESASTRYQHLSPDVQSGYQITLREEPWTQAV